MATKADETGITWGDSIFSINNPWMKSSYGSGKEGSTTPFDKNSKIFKLWVDKPFTSKMLFLNGTPSYIQNLIKDNGFLSESKPYIYFFIESLRPNFRETAMPMKNLNEGFTTYLMGEEPISLDVSGVLMYSDRDNWAELFLDLYRTVLRASKLAELTLLNNLEYHLVARVQGKTYEGSMINLTQESTSTNEQVVRFSFTFLVRSIKTDEDYILDTLYESEITNNQIGISDEEQIVADLEALYALDDQYKKDQQQLIINEQTIQNANLTLTELKDEEAKANSDKKLSEAALSIAQSNAEIAYQKGMENVDSTNKSNLESLSLTKRESEALATSRYNETLGNNSSVESSNINAANSAYANNINNLPSDISNKNAAREEQYQSDLNRIAVTTQPIIEEQASKVEEAQNNVAVLADSDASDAVKEDAIAKAAEATIALIAAENEQKGQQLAAEMSKTSDIVYNETTYKSQKETEFKNQKDTAIKAAQNDKQYADLNAQNVLRGDYQNSSSEYAKGVLKENSRYLDEQAELKKTKEDTIKTESNNATEKIQKLDAQIAANKVEQVKVSGIKYMKEQENIIIANRISRTSPEDIQLQINQKSQELNNVSQQITVSESNKKGTTTSTKVPNTINSAKASKVIKK